MHARAQIRASVLLTLTGLASSGAHVFMSRPETRPLPESSLPALRIFTLSEQSGLVDDAHPMQRTMELAVEAVAQATSGLDDMLDQMCSEVETAMLNNIPAGVHRITLDSTDIQMDGNGEQAHGMAQMRFTIEYYTREGAPEVMI